MNTYKQMEKNTVDAKGQLRESAYVRFHYPEHEGMRVLFLGNSITLHGVCAEIGWHNEWGMAASAEEKDYVHLLEKAILAKDPDAAFCICQVSSWERQYQTGSALLADYEAARQFGADVIVLRFIENCPAAGFDPDAFQKELDTLVRYFNREEKARVIVTTGFWHHPGDGTLCAYAEKHGWPCVALGDLGEDDAMKAVGLFAHNGVANHPGDLGMQRIAERILTALSSFAE